MSGRRRRWSTANVLIAIFLTVGLVLGIGLVVLGGDSARSEQPPKGSSAKSDSSSSTASTTTTPRGELKIDGTDVASVTKLTGLAFPAGMTDFLTAELEGKSQLDITFVMASEEVAGFLSDSGLPNPKADQRMILHSSPLWKLNPDEDTTLSGTQDDHEDVHRVVELLKNSATGEGKVRARIVITPN